jgi:hypothetical protein
MTLEDRAHRMLSYATLERTRALLHSRGARAMAVFIGVAYAFAAMLVGEMLVLAANTGPHYTLVLWSSGNGTAPWNYPALLVSAGWGSLALPFFPTVAMGVMAAGVGVGMSVSVLLAVRLIRQPRRTPGAPTLAGSAAGLTPAMIALVTLGACCSTTAAATAGLGVIAQASGTTIDELLANNWYIGVFQILVLWIALIAQEQLISAYGVLFGLGAGAGQDAKLAAPLTARTVAGGLTRVLLVGIGVITALAMLVDWTQTSPLGAPAGSWFRWIVQDEAPALLAVVAGLFPRALAEMLGGWGSRAGRMVFRGTVGWAGVALLAWFPSGVMALGVHGFSNQLLGLLGAPAGWGALPMSTSTGGDALVQGVLSYGVLGIFCVALALRPSIVLLGLLGERAEGSSDRTADAGPTATLVTASPARPFDAVGPTARDGAASLVAPTAEAER